MEFASGSGQITDAKGAVYTFDYDALNRKTMETYPADEYGASRTDSYWYDAAGNLIQYNKTTAIS